MSKIGSHDPFGHLNISYGQRKGCLNLEITLSWKSPWFPYMQVACHIPLESSWRGIQLCFRPHLDKRFAKEVMGLQSRRNLDFGNFGIPTWESQNKWHLGVGHLIRNKEYYKGEGGGFPQVQAMVNLVSLCLPMIHVCTKNAPTMH
jgi:hypothetical protein